MRPKAKVRRVISNTGESIAELVRGRISMCDPHSMRGKANCCKPCVVKGRFGEPSELLTIEKTRQRIGKNILPKIVSHAAKSRAETQRNLVALNERRLVLKSRYIEERAKLDLGQRASPNSAD